MSISDEAVEAARAAILREFPYDENAGYMARLALEAAAPNLMGAAWDEGREDGYHNRPNPYKEAGE